METFSDLIRQIPFFAGLSRENLARIVGKLEEEKFACGEIIVKQGEPGDALYIVQAGAVEVVLENDGAVVQSITILGPNECFGEMALFTGEKRSATVRAFIDSAVLKLSKENWEELLSRHPSLSLHFCKVLSRRLADTNRDISKGRGAFNLVMEEFFAAQPKHLQDFLIRTSILRTLDPEAIRLVLLIDNPGELLAFLSSQYPTFLRTNQEGHWEYRDYLQNFLTTKRGQSVGSEETNGLHRKFASYFSNQAQWLSAMEHYVRAEAWNDALDLIKVHREQILENEPSREILSVLEFVPADVARGQGELERLRAEAYERLGNIDGAIRSYQDFLANHEVATADAIEYARCYQELAELHRRKGELGEALGCLQLATNLVEGSKGDLDAVEALRSLELLQQKRGAEQEAVSWGRKALELAEKLKIARGSRTFGWNKRGIGFVLALVVGLGVWQMRPPLPLDVKGGHFLAVMMTAVALWMFEVFDEYVVAILLLLSWLLFDIVPPKMALAGFSASTWFFFLGLLGIAAGVNKTGLLYRAALQTLSWLRPSYKNYSVLLGISGLLFCPLLPNITARIAVMAPISLAISESMGFKPRSNGSAGLAFATFVGFSQVSFTFLTGATACLFGWNLLPEAVRAQFGWTTWAIAALPAGVFILIFLVGAVLLLFPAGKQEESQLSAKTLNAQLELLGPLTFAERIALFLMAVLLLGLIGKPLHGINEAWIALAVLTGFLVTGILDKRDLKNNIDWGFLLFFGVISALNEIVPHLKLDALLARTLNPVLSLVSFSPLPFLSVVLLIVYFVRLFLTRYPAMILLALGLIPLAQGIGIHPGILLLTLLMAIDSWFLIYQTEYYQIAYYSTEEKAFSHAQARKLMVAKFLATFLAVAISVPYWRMLGFIR